ncbi:MAG: hypothetical protein JWN67_3203 [Actinomycetia bacterium]|nr:hypothetical protein [Actinomycetes bacterium]
MDRIGRFVGRLGGKLGIAVSLLGFLLIYLGWNGAGSFNDIRQQFPYLISGGIAGLAFVILGAALLVIEAARTERAELQATLLELREALEGVGSATPAVVRAVASGDLVVAGASSYHRQSCRLVGERDDLELLSSDDAAERGLAPCRICDPETAAVA